MTKRIFVPTDSYRDWQRLLASPDRHWKPGYSAMTLARSWEAAGASGFPPEVKATLESAQAPKMTGLELLFATPEFKVPLPGGERASQTDLFALARGPRGLVAIAVEGKVDETFGPTVGEKRSEGSEGVDKRLSFLLQTLELPPSIPESIRYQLLHRNRVCCIARGAVLRVRCGDARTFLQSVEPGVRRFPGVRGSFRRTPCYWEAGGDRGARRRPAL